MVDLKAQGLSLLYLILLGRQNLIPWVGDKPVRMIRISVVIKCRSCGKTGHNMKTCLRRQARVATKVSNSIITIYYLLSCITCYNIVSVVILGKCW